MNQARKALAEAAQSINNDLMVRGDFVFNKSTNLVAYKKHPIRFTTMQYNLLEYLAKHPLRIRGPYDIAHAIDMSDDIDQYFSVASHIKRIRAKFPAEANPIGTVRGTGWYFDDGTDEWIK